MEDQLINFSTADLSARKGFNEPCRYRYENGNISKWLITEGRKQTYHRNEVCIGSSAPTQSLLQKWLREEYNLHIYVVPNGNNLGWRIANLRDIKVDKLVYDIKEEFQDTLFNTYEEALEVGLQEALKLIDDKV